MHRFIFPRLIVLIFSLPCSTLALANAGLMHFVRGEVSATDGQGGTRQLGKGDSFAAGDAIMAFWGAPVADAEHAHHAVRAALAMQAQLPELNAELARRGWPALGIGINSGQMTVGDMGSPLRQSYTVMGDAVNLASRLEGVTKQYGIGIVIGEATRDLLQDRFLLREIDCIRVKGRQEPLRIYEPLMHMERASSEERQLCADWHDFLASYRQQRWEEARKRLAAMAGQLPAGLLQRYQHRLAQYAATPPAEDWDGVTDLAEK